MYKRAGEVDSTATRQQVAISTIAFSHYNKNTYKHRQFLQGLETNAFSVELFWD